MTSKLSIANIDRFVFAGDAVVTLVRPARAIKRTVEIAAREETGEPPHQPVVVEELDPEVRFTYRVQRAEGEDTDRPWFVKVLTGPDNLRDYSFVGTIFPGESGEVAYRHSARKSRIGEDAASVRGIAWLVGHLSALRTLSAETVGADLFRKPEIGDDALPHVQALAKVEVYHEDRCGRCARRLTVPSSVIIGIGPDCAEIMGLGPLDLLARAIGSDPIQPDPSSEPPETPQGC